MGLLHHQIGDSLAIAYFNNALETQANSIEAHYNLGYYYQQNNYFNKAVNQYNIIINDIDSTYKYAHFNIAYINLNYLKNYNLAISYFTNAIKYDYIYQ